MIRIFFWRISLEAVDYLSAEKCLFGTDGPYGVHGDDGLFDHGFIKRRIERLFPDKEIQKKLLGENFLELIHIWKGSRDLKSKT